MTELELLRENIDAEYDDSYGRSFSFLEKFVKEHLYEDQVAYLGIGWSCKIYELDTLMEIHDNDKTDVTYSVMKALEYFCEVYDPLNQKIVGERKRDGNSRNDSN